MNTSPNGMYGGTVIDGIHKIFIFPNSISPQLDAELRRLKTSRTKPTGTNSVDKSVGEFIVVFPLNSQHMGSDSIRTTTGCVLKYHGFRPSCVDLCSVVADTCC